MADFLQEIAPLLKIEGGLNTNKADRGGLTKYGISQKSYPKLDIESLTPEIAAQLYKRDYWDKIGGDKLPPATAAVAFDAAVNHGVGKAKALLMYSGGDPQKMIAKRKSLYDKIAQQDPSQRQFHNGWISRLETLAGRVSSMLNPISTAQADETPWKEPDIQGLHNEFAQWKQSRPKDYGNRPNGTKKGTGFLGELPMQDGSGNVATEMTIGVNLDGKETDIPAIVPTLNQEQKDYLLAGGDVNKRTDIIKAAALHAKDRIAKGLSPYANEEINSQQPNIADLHNEFSQWKQSQPKEKTAGQKVGEVITDIGGGVLKGASNIGNSLLSAGDAYNEFVGNKNALSSLETTGAERRAQATEGLKEMGANPDSLAFKTGELGTEIAGTAGMGSAIAPAAKALPYVNKLAPAIESWGMSGGNIAQKSAGGAITGAASSALVDPETAGTGAIVGGVLPPAMQAAGKVGQAIGSSIKKALPSGKGISQEVKDLAKKAKGYGIDIPIDKIANSKPLNALAKSLEYVPFSGREATQEAMHKQVNKAVSRTIGQDNANINKALRDADLNLGAQFEKTLQENPVKVDDLFMEGLGRVEKEAESILVKDQFAVIKKQIDNILEKGGTGQIDGEAAYNIKKLLDKLGKGSDTTKATVAIDLKRELMDALDRSLGTEKAAAFKKVREQYGNMLELEKIARNGAEGEISIARLANMKNVRSKELKDLADIAAQFVTEREGQHGAMQRVVAGGAMGATAGLPGLAAGAAGGKALNSILNSKTLRNKLIGDEVIKKGGNKFANLTRQAPKLAPAAIQLQKQQ